MTKQRTFASGMNRRYKLIFSNPVSGMKKDYWVKLSYQFTQNFPANLLEESQIAGNLAGITSKQTQLKVLSVVDNVQNEIDQIEKEQDEDGYMTDYPTSRMVAENTENPTGDGNGTGGDNNGGTGQGAQRSANTKLDCYYGTVYSRKSDRRTSG